MAHAPQLPTPKPGLAGSQGRIIKKIKMLSFQLSPTLSFHVSGLAPSEVRAGLEPTISHSIDGAFPNTPPDLIVLIQMYD